MNTTSLRQVYPDSERIGSYDADGKWVVPTRNLGNLSLDILQYHNLTNLTQVYKCVPPAKDADPTRIGKYCPDGQWVVPQEIFSSNGTGDPINCTAHAGGLTQKSNCVPPAKDADPTRIGKYCPDG